jgi:hypothetical protein
LTSDAEPEPEDITRDQARPPSSHGASLPPSSPEPDDFIDEVLGLEDERISANPVVQEPVARYVPKKSSNEHQDEGIMGDDEAAWDELMTEQDGGAFAPPPIQPPLDNDQEMWDIVDEVQMQVETEDAGTNVATAPGSGSETLAALRPGSDRAVYGDDWDDMYAD